MAATASAAPAESELDRSGAEDEPRSAEPEEDGGTGQAGPTAAAQQHRLAKLPLSRIKALMKADPDVSLASQESVFIIAKATVRYTHKHVLDSSLSLPSSVSLSIMSIPSHSVMLISVNCLSLIIYPSICHVNGLSLSRSSAYLFVCQMHQFI